MEKGESRSYFERIRSHFRRRKVEYIIGGTLLGFSIGGIIAVYDESRNSRKRKEILMLTPAPTYTPIHNIEDGIKIYRKDN
jgi:hypothetical protein